VSDTRRTEITTSLPAEDSLTVEVWVGGKNGRWVHSEDYNAGVRS
jgi:hypothetical protein